MFGSEFTNCNKRAGVGQRVSVRPPQALAVDYDVPVNAVTHSVMTHPVLGQNLEQAENAIIVQFVIRGFNLWYWIEIWPMT